MKMLNYRPTIIKILIAYAITFMVHNLGGFVSFDIILGVLFVAVYAILCGAKLIEVEATKKQRITSIIVSILWTLSYVIYSADRMGNGLDNKAFAGFYILLTVLGLYLVVYAVVRYVIVKCNRQVLFNKLDVGEIIGTPMIKMDIERAEEKALIGMEHFIKKYRPYLAICIYHREEDIYRIPKLIKEYVPNYKLYIRDGWQLECWAVPQ